MIRGIMLKHFFSLSLFCSFALAVPAWPLREATVRPSESITFDRRNELRLRYGYQPPTLNPLSTEGFKAVDIQFYVIEALLLQNEDTYEWQPWLADQWK